MNKDILSFEDFDYIESNVFKGKIILIPFPGLDIERKFREKYFILELNLFKNNNCSSITSFVEDSEFEKFCDKKYFVKKIYQHNLNWYHLPIADLNIPSYKFQEKWETIKVLLKNELTEGKNIILHCLGGKGRAGTIAAILLIEFGYDKQEAIGVVRERRKGAIETKKQKDFVLSYRAIN